MKKIILLELTTKLFQLTQTPPLRIPRQTWSGMMSLE